MNILSNLLLDACPDGVPYFTFKSVAKLAKGVQFNKKDMLDEGTFPVINGGVLPSGYIEQYNCKRDTITISQGGASAGYVNWIESNFWAGAHCYIVEPSERIDNRYLYHFLKSKEYLLQSFQYGAGIPALSKATVEGLLIPVPPLEVQAEIARILDNFTELTAKLTAELTAELTTRKEQYEYYNQKVFSFENATSYKLEDICSVITDGSHWSPPKKAGEYYMASVKDMSLNGFDYSNCKTISESDFKSLVGNGCRPEKGDVLVAKDGATMLKYSFVADGLNNLVVLSSIAIIRPDPTFVYPEYLNYYFRRKDFKENAIRKYSTVGGVPRIILKGFKKMDVLVPPLEEQKRIIIIMNQFDKVYNDITDGLLAEIEARQKQYEFYRDKLLTFPELKQ